MLNDKNSIAKLFSVYAEQEIPPIIELQNIDHKPIGALYLAELKYKKLVVSETNNQERYYLYIDGVGIYFSFFKKIVA